MRRDRHVHRWASTSPGTGICLMVQWGTEALPECLCSRPVHRRAPLVSLPLHILIFVMSTPDLCLLPGLVDRDRPGPDPGERVKGGLTLKLHLWSLFLTVWSGCGHPAGDNFVELLVVFTKRSIYWYCFCLDVVLWFFPALLISSILVWVCW